MKSKKDQDNKIVGLYRNTKDGGKTWEFKCVLLYGDPIVITESEYVALKSSRVEIPSHDIKPDSVVYGFSVTLQ